MHWPLLLAAIAASVVAQGLLKAGAGAGSVMAQMLSPRTIVGLGIYGFSALAYIIALRRIPLSVALPCTAMSYIFVAAVGHFVFAEPIGAQRVLGLALVGAGVLALATS